MLSYKYNNKFNKFNNNELLLIACKSNDLLSVKQLLNFTDVDASFNNNEAMAAAIKNWNFKIIFYLFTFKNKQIEYWIHKPIKALMYKNN